MGELSKEINMLEVKPIRDIVYECLRNKIVEGKIKPGERIIEKDYAELMNISRTPVREALRKLETEGFVQCIPRKGALVSEFSIKDILEIYAIRQALEELAIKSCIQNITEKEINKLVQLTEEMDFCDKKGDIETVFAVCKKFNDTILTASKMPRLKNLIDTLQEHLEKFRRITMAKSERRKDAIQEHKEILKAIIDKDEEKAEKLIGEHLEASKNVFLKSFK